MKLGHWIKREKLTLEQFGDRIGRGHSAVQRYILETRFPGRETLVRIFVETNGEVTPNDFVDLPMLVAGRVKAVEPGQSELEAAF